MPVIPEQKQDVISSRPAWVRLQDPFSKEVERKEGRKGRGESWRGERKKGRERKRRKITDDRRSSLHLKLNICYLS